MRAGTFLTFQLTNPKFSLFNQSYYGNGLEKAPPPQYAKNFKLFPLRFILKVWKSGMCDKAWPIADHAIADLSGNLYFAIARWSPIFTLKNDGKEIAIVKFDDRYLAIAWSLVKTRLKINSFQNNEFVMLFMSSELKKIMALLASLESTELSHTSLLFFTILPMFP